MVFQWTSLLTDNCNAYSEGLLAGGPKQWSNFDPDFVKQKAVSTLAQSIKRRTPAPESNSSKNSHQGKTPMRGLPNATDCLLSGFVFCCFLAQKINLTYWYKDWSGEATYITFRLCLY